MNPQPKQKTIIDKPYLDWIREQPCYDCIGGFGDITYSHQTLKIPERGKGTSLKDHDILALPKHSSEHYLEHQGIYRIKNPEHAIAKHIFRYKTEIDDKEFIETVESYIKTSIDETMLFENYIFDLDLDTQVFSYVIGHIISIWEDHR